MITMTINSLLNVIPVLRELNDKPFKGAAAFKLARIMREIDKEIILFEEARAKLAEKYGKRDESNQIIIDLTGKVQLQEEKMEECNEEMLGLLNTEIKINAEKIPVEAFSDIELTPSQIIIIDSLIDY